jgi:hypothetical protein
MNHVTSSANVSSRQRIDVQKALVLAGLVWLLTGGSMLVCASGETGTWTGYVTDTHCGTNCQVTSAMKPDIRCIRECVKKGSKYGLWSGKQVYVLEPQAKAERFAAENVRITGTLHGDMIQISSIEQVPRAAKGSAP